MPIPFVWPAQEILRLLDIPSYSNNPPNVLHIVKDDGLYAMTQNPSEPYNNQISFAVGCSPDQDPYFISLIAGESDIITDIPRKTIVELYNELSLETKNIKPTANTYFFLVIEGDRMGFGFSLEDPRPFMDFTFTS